MTTPETRNPGWRAGASWKSAGERRFHVDHATAEPLLQRLEGVQKSGNGWRAKCPACGGTSRKVTIAERDGKVLLHCFGGCKAIEVLEAVGLAWADIMPPRHWPESPEERRRMRQAIREAGWASALSVLALATGLRQSNIRLLKWEDVDFDNWTLAIRETKNGQPRHVPVVGMAQRTLQAHYDRDPTQEGWVFKGYRDGAPWSLHSAWQRVRANAGLADFRFHDLRHTVASYLTQGGAGLAQVADALGHKTLVMARRYSHQSAEHVRATLATIAGKLEEE